MKIAVLAAGITPDELLVQHGSYADMVMVLLKGASDEFEFQVFDVRLNDFPKALSDFDGFVITGSRNNVSENLDWMKTLKILIQTTYKARQPMLGICFGHQIIADALGGQVARYDGGWGLGLHEYKVEQGLAFLPKELKSFAINAVHQDQVMVKPEVAQVFAGSSFCQNAGLVYDDLILTLQAHPEFNMAFEDALITFRTPDVFPLDDSKVALAGLKNKETDSKHVAKWLAGFLLNK